MNKFGSISKQKLSTVHPILQVICHNVIPFKDFTVAWGWRGEAAQDQAFNDGYSKVKFPKSKHNKSSLLNNSTMSDAIDIYPWVNNAISYDRLECTHLAGMILQAGAALELHKIGLELIWGGNWDSDNEIITDQMLADLGHFELRQINIEG